MRQKIKAILDSVRAPDRSGTLAGQIFVSIGVLCFGALLGVVQKWLDGTAANELPALLQRLDIGNFFGRLGIWILLATILSVYANTPNRAAINVFLLFISMLSCYYLYCHFVLGFLPVSYMMLWVRIACVSPVLAWLCWYAKGQGIAAVLLSGGILGVLFSQAFLIMQGIMVTHLLEVVVWIVGCVVLRREPKEFVMMLGVSLGTAVVYQLFIPYWG